MTVPQTRTFPPGVPCWIDVTTPDVDGAAAFYAALLGWDLTDVGPSHGPDRYLVATLDGQDVAAVGAATGAAGWRTYVATDDTDAALARAVELGGTPLAPAADAGPGGRAATFADPQGHALSLWQPRGRPGVQVANLPGAWNFSNLRTADVAAASRFYCDLFGWRFADQGWATAIQVPGYGDHLEATIDPDIRTRQADAPDGFEDVVGALVGLDESRPPGWYVIMTIDDRDDAAAAADGLGATVLAQADTEWTRDVVIRDPQGAELTLSQFTPPTDCG